MSPSQETRSAGFQSRPATPTFVLIYDCSSGRCFCWSAQVWYDRYWAGSSRAYMPRRCRRSSRYRLRTRLAGWLFMAILFYKSGSRKGDCHFSVVTPWQRLLIPQRLIYRTVILRSIAITGLSSVKAKLHLSDYGLGQSSCGGRRLGTIYIFL